MFLLGDAGGWAFQAKLWSMCEAGRLLVHTPGADEVPLMRQLMDRYADTPMDMADASLVAASQFLGIRRIFTIDSHFVVFRLEDGSPLQLVPAE